MRNGLHAEEGELKYQEDYNRIEAKLRAQNMKFKQFLILFHGRVVAVYWLSDLHNGP